MSRRWVGLLLWMSVAFAGCGGSLSVLSDDKTPEWTAMPSAPVALAQVRVRQLAPKAKQPATGIRRLRYLAHDMHGNLVFGPRVDDWRVDALLEHVPVTAESLTIEALSSEDESVVGRAVLPLTLRQGQTTHLANPTFENLAPAFTSLRVSPASAPLRPTHSLNLRAFGRYPDGQEVELTHRVRWSSTQPALLTVGNTPGQRGRVVSLQETQGEVRVEARFPTDQVLLAELEAASEQGVITHLDPALGTRQASGPRVDAKASMTTLDLDGDGREEVVHSSGSQVRCVDSTGQERWSFQPWQTLPGSTLHLASHDLDGDGQEELFAAGLRSDGRAQVVAFDGATLGDPSPRRLFVIGGLSDNFVNGVCLASGQDGDGTTALALGAGPGRSPEVQVYRLVRDRDGTWHPMMLRRFLAFDAAQRGGARVALGDIDADGLLELLTATGPGELPRLRASLLATGQQLWMANLGDTPSFDGVRLATGQLQGSFGDDIAACVASRSADQAGQLFLLDGPSGRKVRTFEAGTGRRCLVAVGNVAGAGLSASSQLRLTTARPSRLELSSPVITLNPAEPQARLRVRARFSDGQLLDVSDLASFSLPSGDQQAVLLDPQGLATALEPGTVTTRAQYAGLAVEGTLHSLTASRLRSLSLVPPSELAQVGLPAAFQVYASLEGGPVVDFTQRALWTSDTESVLSFPRLPDRRGVAQVVGEGTALVTATAPNLEVAASLPFTVNTPPRLTGLSVEPARFTLGRLERQRLRLMARYEDGSVRQLKNGVRWRTSDPGLSVDGSGEVMSGERALAASVVATVSGLDGSASAKVQVEVTPPRLVSLAGLPGELTLRPQEVRQLRVEGQFDRGDTSVDPSGLSFSSSDPSAVSVSSNGLVRAGDTLGSAEITVKHRSGVCSVVPIRVEPLSPSLLNLKVVLDNSSLVDGLSTAATATATYSTGPRRNLKGAVVWSVSNPALASIDSHGIITARAPGILVVRASHAATGVYGEASLTISPAELVGLAISPRNPNLLPGDSVPLHLFGTYTNGEVRSLGQGANWVSLNPSVFSFPSSSSTSGKAAQPGTALVVATLGGLSASLPVHVLEP
jgi:hypothetical protein